MRILSRVDEGLGFIRKAIALDPLSARTHRQAGIIAVNGGRLEDAVASFQLAVDLAPTAGLHHAFLALALLLQGRAQEALAVAEHESHPVFHNLALSMIHRTLGHTADSDAALKALIDEFAWTAAFQIAEAYSHRNEIDKAFKWLERAYEQRDPGAIYCASDPFLRALHGDPRWQAFLHKMRLA